MFGSAHPAPLSLAPCTHARHLQGGSSQTIAAEASSSQGQRLHSRSSCSYFTHTDTNTTCPTNHPASHDPWPLWSQAISGRTEPRSGRWRPRAVTTSRSMSGMRGHPAQIAATDMPMEFVLMQGGTGALREVARSKLDLHAMCVHTMNEEGLGGQSLQTSWSKPDAQLGRPMSMDHSETYGSAQALPDPRPASPDGRMQFILRHRFGSWTGWRRRSSSQGPHA